MPGWKVNLDLGYENTSQYDVEIRVCWSLEAVNARHFLQGISSYGPLGILCTCRGMAERLAQRSLNQKLLLLRLCGGTCCWTCIFGPLASCKLLANPAWMSQHGPRKCRCFSGKDLVPTCPLDCCGGPPSFDQVFPGRSSKDAAALVWPMQLRWAPELISIPQWDAGTIHLQTARSVDGEVAIRSRVYQLKRLTSWSPPDFPHGFTAPKAGGVEGSLSSTLSCYSIIVSASAAAMVWVMHWTAMHGSN